MGWPTVCGTRRRRSIPARPALRAARWNGAELIRAALRAAGYATVGR